MTAVTVVCCSMISLIQMRYGSAELRQGRSRAWRTYHAVSLRRNRARVGASNSSGKSAMTSIVQTRVRDAKRQDAQAEQGDLFLRRRQLDHALFRVRRDFDRDQPRELSQFAQASGAVATIAVVDRQLQLPFAGLRSQRHRKLDRRSLAGQIDLVPRTEVLGCNQ